MTTLTFHLDVDAPQQQNTTDQRYRTGMTQNQQTILNQRFRAVMDVSQLGNLSLSPYELPEPTLVNINTTQSIFSVVDICPDLHCSDASCEKSGWLADHPLRVGYALAEPSQATSKVQIGLYFTIIVILANSLKAVAIFMTLRMCSSRHLLTVGDAVASYLERPEARSAGQCLLERADILRSDKPAKPQVWHSRRTYIIQRRLWSTANHRPIIATASLVSLASDHSAATSSQGTARLHSWGTASKSVLPFTMSSFSTRGVLTNALLANTPQLLLSSAYFSVNRLCTSICFAREWNGFARAKKGLRVTAPSCEQRGTHFLQMPYRWAVPLAVASGVLHWLLSQTLFLVRFEKRGLSGALYPGSLCACGYSPLSLLVFTVCFVALCLVIFGLVVMPMRVHVPLASHCSLVVSAACHPPVGDGYAHLGKVQWGAVRVDKEDGDEVGHCTFPRGVVGAPMEGEMYA
ncbi:hypothetical protein K491DRAFT_699231 [Lophiostoma macrostomum CBS 122681]|uniref:Uncharacterized protein n=1 Tax=Lophiostoma macrostomum CBS 122681 TaxID=1314788 RepID=A0A6A6SN67_9PLEO|nr:hypothetical protein K491DRAFT_699231 [Lophiostoma macrostomum CBS 122681]